MLDRSPEPGFAACRLVALVAAALALSGCERDREPAPAPSAAVVEAADPDMLLEGPLVVMGLRLPVGADVSGKNLTAASVRVPHPMEKVASYLRAHLDAPSVDTGPQKTVFSQARPKGVSTGPLLKIVVVRRLFGTELLINQDRDPNRVATPSPGTSADRVGVQSLRPSPEGEPSPSAEPAPSAGIVDD